MTDTSAEIIVLNKATLKVVESLPIDGIEVVENAVAKAKKAQVAWAALPAKERAKLMKKARREFVRDKDKIKAALEAETGKPPFDVIGEMLSVCQSITHFAKKAPKWLKSRKVSPMPLFGKKAKIFYKPRGLVAVISPWNAPLNLAMGDIVPALLAGNAVLVKPSEITPLAVKYTVEAFNRALPTDVLQCLIGAGETGAALVDRVDLVAVTGSCLTGKKVMESASKNLTPVLLELGGKDPMIILKDANLERAANAAAWGSCFMTGQVCMSIERIYVEKTVAVEFIEKLKGKMEAMRTGPERATEDRDFGPFIGPAQIAIVERHVASARASGATILVGGERIQKEDEGVFFQPTLITDVDHSMEIMKEETFGPVVCVMAVDDVEQALELANDSEYGLNASVWTNNVDYGIQIANRIESGNVCVNEAILNAGVLDLPFGGIKQSGVGTRHGGADGIRIFCQAQSMLIGKAKKNGELPWFPYTTKKTNMLEKLMVFMYGRGK